MNMFYILAPEAPDFGAKIQTGIRAGRNRISKICHLSLPTNNG